MFDSILTIIQLIGKYMWYILPGAITLSGVYAGFLWIIAGSNAQMVARAKKQLKATIVVLVVIAGYWIIKAVIIDFAFNQGGNFG